MGPGLVSTSPARINREISQEMGDFFKSIFRTKLLLMLNGEVENGLGGVRAKLTWGREKRACSLSTGWISVRGGECLEEGGCLGRGGGVSECRRVYGGRTEDI